jgi:MFS transporter, PAT family, beta-lactamase induction signal transducer AmpG
MTARPLRSPWAWIPTLYVAEGLPYVMVMNVAGMMYKTLGVSNTVITLSTNLLNLPWVFKFFWSPVVEVLGTRRRWIWTTQLIAGALLGAVALAIPVPHVLRWTLALFCLLAFDSATHDIAADGFYLLSLSEKQQSFFVGIRTTAYRAATIAGQGLLVILAGIIGSRTGNVRLGWSVAMATTMAALLLFGLWHRLVLPRPAPDRAGTPEQVSHLFRQSVGTIGSFFRKPRIGVLVAFLLLYRFGEAQLVAVAKLFLLDPRAEHGLGLTVTEVGFLYGMIGVIALILGGVLGGIVVSRHGLKRWLWPMLLAIHLPDAVFIWLAYAQPTNLLLIQLGIAVEQFGYGFGFTAYLLYMIRIARGEHQIAHYAICTCFMALGMMLPGMWSGWLADHLGYGHFFTWVILATIPSFLVALWIPLEPEFGRRAAA